MSSASEPGAGRLTLEEYEALPEDDRYRDEVVRGMLVREPQPAQLHGRLQLHIGGMLDRFVRESRAGVVFVEAGYVLESEPLTLRGPDVSFVVASRVPPDPYAPGYWRLAPDLAVEVLSPSNRYRDTAEKLRDYFAAGVRLAWIVDPAKRTVTVHRPGAASTVLRDRDARISGEDVIPGFDVSLAQLFDI